MKQGKIHRNKFTCICFFLFSIFGLSRIMKLGITYSKMTVGAHAPTAEYSCPSTRGATRIGKIITTLTARQAYRVAIFLCDSIATISDPKATIKNSTSATVIGITPPFKKGAIHHLRKLGIHQTFQ